MKQSKKTEKGPLSMLEGLQFCCHVLSDHYIQRAGSGVPKALLARNYGISRETVYQYLRQAKLE